MRDKLGNELADGDLICWSASGYFGGLRFGKVYGLLPNDMMAGPYVEKGVVVVDCQPYRTSRYQKKYRRKHPNEVVLVRNKEPI